MLIQIQIKVVKQHFNISFVFMLQIQIMIKGDLFDYSFSFIFVLYFFRKNAVKYILDALRFANDGESL
jgi:hypothetical protein